LRAKSGLDALESEVSGLVWTHVSLGSLSRELGCKESSSRDGDPREEVPAEKLKAAELRSATAPENGPRGDRRPEEVPPESLRTSAARRLFTLCCGEPLAWNGSREFSRGGATRIAAWHTATEFLSVPRGTDQAKRSVFSFLENFPAEMISCARNSRPQDRCSLRNASRGQCSRSSRACSRDCNYRAATCSEDAQAASQASL
jgi:hypothetical protein